jgi:Holliday junction resolvasome RuvABC DNA-binding subunit
MAYKAKDGAEFTNLPQLKRHELRLGDSKPVQDTDSDQDAQKDITQDPEAMDCVEKLKSLGYTGEEVEQAFNEGGDQGDQEAPQSAVPNASVQIPGLK